MGNLRAELTQAKAAWILKDNPLIKDLKAKIAALVRETDNKNILGIESDLDTSAAKGTCSRGFYVQNDQTKKECDIKGEWILPTQEELKGHCTVAGQKVAEGKIAHGDCQNPG